MKSLSRTDSGVLITGSSGFIGKHMCAQFDSLDQAAPETRAADVMDRACLRALALEWDVSTVIHLAGRSRVVAPIAFAPAMFAAAIEGTFNVLESFAPGVLLLASTCAVYGTTGEQGTIAGETPPNPVGLYGFSRAACENLAAAWAVETGKTAIVIRCGNVIGEGCGGLIPYLVDHALRFPDGKVPARLRGNGRIIRDYVPVSHVAKVFAMAARHSWHGVTHRVFNVGSGRGKTNGEVAEIVTEMLAGQGYKLRIEYSKEPGLGESRQANLDVRVTTHVFGVEPPSEDTVYGAISAAVSSHQAKAGGVLTTAAVAR